MDPDFDKKLDLGKQAEDDFIQYQKDLGYNIGYLHRTGVEYFFENKERRFDLWRVYENTGSKIIRGMLNLPDMTLFTRTPKFIEIKTSEEKNYKRRTISIKPESLQTLKDIQKEIIPIILVCKHGDTFYGEYFDKVPYRKMQREDYYIVEISDLQELTPEVVETLLFNNRGDEYKVK